MKKTIKILKKLLIIILIILLINNFLFVPVVKANVIQDACTSFLLSFLGLLTFPVRAIVLGAARGIDLLTAAIAYAEGATDSSTDTTTITPFDIFFNKVKILDVNFFEIGKDVNIVNTIRTGIATWYYTLRLIAMAILLVVFIYIGIRMAISTIASDKAMYKRMLFDWIVSLVLIFFINYIIIFIINLNNSIIKALENSVKAEEISNVYSSIMGLGFSVFDIDSIPATVIYCMLIVQTFGLVISYFNRMLKVAFLIIISPLITLTYAVDKMGDGKAQALGNWLKEFIFTVITQVFHCIIYMSMINVTFSVLTKKASTGIGDSLATAIMAILCVGFVKTAENLVRKILMNNHEDNSLSVSGGMAVAAVALSKSKSIGSATRKAANVTRQNLKAAGNALKKTPNAVKNIATAPKKGISALSTAIKNESEWKKIKKENNFNNLKKENKQEYKVKKQLHKEAIKKAAQKELAAKQAKKQLKQGKKLAKKKINKVKGTTLNKLNRIASQSDTLKFLHSVEKGYMAVATGALAGSLMYGATGDISQAGMMAVTGYQSQRAFQKSARNLQNTTQSNLIGAGAKTQEEAFAILDQVASNPYLYDGKSPESQKQAKELLKKIGNQLIQSVGDADYKSIIKNEFDRTAIACPERMLEAKNRAFERIADEETEKMYPDLKDEDAQKYRESVLNDLKNNQGLNEACNNYSQFANMKQIYSQMETAKEMGISKDAYVQECTEHFVSQSTKSKLENFVNDLSDEEFNDLSNNIEENCREIEEQLEEANKRDDEKSAKKYNQEIKKIQRLESAIASRLIVEKQRILNESQRKILENVKEQCLQEINAILKELKIELSSTDDYSTAVQNATGITTQQLENQTIDDIILERQKKLKKFKGKDDEAREKIKISIQQAQMFKQIQTLETRNNNIEERLNISTN